MIKVIESRLEAMAAWASQYPEGNLPEIAFAGRSNVGKSTFINRFLNRKKLAYTSASPGKTRTVNFYNVDERFRLVDLPGYGFAKAAKSEQEKWAKIINLYLTERENLEEVILLVDLRHMPTAQDKQMYGWLLESGFTGYVIATKADKVPSTKRLHQAKLIRQALGIERADRFFIYSGLERTGLEQIHELVASLLDLDVGGESES